MLPNSFGDLIATLVSNGLNIHKVDRLPHDNTIIHAYKYDKLGAKVNYSMLFTEDADENSISHTLLAESAQNNSTPLIISDHFTSLQCKTYTKKDFFNFFGGILNTGLILIPNLDSVLKTLGHNQLPLGLTGKPEQLHEMYIKECLQFILESPTRRYGIDRSFESLPDAVVLSKGGFMLLVDSKAYENGFDFKADDLKRFKSYIEDFRFRYSAYFGNIFTFLVVSGHFNDSQDALLGRSEELYRSCNCRLTCISSEELGKIAMHLKQNAALRNSIDWKNILSDIVVDIQSIKKEKTRIVKDNLH